MIKLQFLDSAIEERVLQESKEKEEKHIPSGKLSASILGQPLQWQILKVIGVPADFKEEYVLRKFLRGRHVEDWLTEYMVGIINKQKLVEYRNVVGWVDAIVDMRDWHLDYGVIPHEIKSVSNLKYKRIEKNGADEQHILQACLYAMALGTDKFAIDYVATDDYRINTLLFDTKEFSGRVESIIDIFDEAVVSKKIPVFEPFLAWHSLAEYNPYKEFVDLSSEEAEEKVKREFPEAYIKLKGGITNEIK